MQKKILIIEDDSVLLQALMEALKNANLAVSEARNGEEGLQKTLAEHPDLILLDIIMPKMDGMALLKELRKDPWGKNIPVIILTNVSDAEKTAEALEGKVYDFLVKTDWKLDDVVTQVKKKLGIV